MKRLKSLFPIALAVALVATIVALSSRSAAAQVTLPPGATITSATFSIYADQVNTPLTVRVHNVTAPWSENTVTWNNFGGAFDPSVVGSF